jgi:hypothetical protein
MTMIPVNSIRIPEQFVEVGSRWWDSTDDTLYALAKYNGLAIGTASTTCPDMVCVDKNDRNRKWYLSVWNRLLDDLVSAIDRASERCKSYEREFNTESYEYSLTRDDLQGLIDFANWAVEKVGALKTSYNLENWRI